jgi:hypothetical protein
MEQVSFPEADLVLLCLLITFDTVPDVSADCSGTTTAVRASLQNCGEFGVDYLAPVAVALENGAAK